MYYQDVDTYFQLAEQVAHERQSRLTLNLLDLADVREHLRTLLLSILIAGALLLQSFPPAKMTPCTTAVNWRRLATERG